MIKSRHILAGCVFGTALGCALSAPFVASAASPVQGSAADPVYAPLWLYDGMWQMSSAAGAKGDILLNQCGVTGKYFACQQTVNGKLAALIIFIPTEKAGHYLTQAVLPDGRAMGRGELEIDGGHWTYHSKDEEDGKMFYHRTINTFTGKDRIHYELSASPDGEHWTTGMSGDEVRVPGPNADK